MIDWWNDADFLTKLAGWLTVLSIVLAIMVALSQYAKIKLDSRANLLRERQQMTRKNTPPLMEVGLGTGMPSGKLLLEIRAKNDIPFRAWWSVVTRQDKHVLSNMFIETIEIFPTKDKKTFQYPAVIASNAVVDNYVKLEFNFESLFAPELNRPSNLSGTIWKEYQYFNGGVYRWDNDPQQGS